MIDEQLFKEAVKFKDKLTMLVYADQCEENAKDEEAQFFRETADNLDKLLVPTTVPNLQLGVAILTAFAEQVHAGKDNHLAKAVRDVLYLAGKMPVDSQIPAKINEMRDCSPAIRSLLNE